MHSIYIFIRHSLMEFFRFLLWHLTYFFPIDRKKIVVCCFKGRGYTDNPKYIIESLLKKRNDLKIIWLVKNDAEAKSLPSEVEACRYNRLGSIYHFITSIIWIDNVRKDEKFIKKRKQFYLQTWHGGGAIKKVELDAIEQLSDGYVPKAQKDSCATDLYIAEGKYYAAVYRKSFWYNGEIAIVGLPRYDVIVNQSNGQTLRNKIHKYFNIINDINIILYAPTFRKGYGFEFYNIDYKRLIDACERKFGGQFVVYVHLHPNVADKFEELTYDNVTIFNATYYPDMQELIAASDLLITDYSSAIVDFSITGKPGFRFAIDAQKYVDERGCYFNFRTEYPYPLSVNNDQLIECIETFDSYKYQKDLCAYFERLGLIKAGTSSDIISNMLIDYIILKDKTKLFDKYRDLLFDKTSNYENSSYTSSI